MGLLGNILNEMAGQGPNLGQGQGQAGVGTGGLTSALIPVLMTMLTNNQVGGPMNRIAGSPLQGLISQFEQAGLGGIAQSWIGQGPNQSVTPQQVHSALGDQEVEAMSTATGMPKETLIQELARVLPSLVDRLTPHGQLPTHAELSESETEAA